MEPIDITLTRLQRRTRVAFVPGASGTDLVPGDGVVLRDEAGEYYAGTVLDRTAAGAEPGHVVKVGVRLPEEYALRRLDAHAGGEPDDGMQELLDLLGEARALLAPGRVPAQRVTR